MKSGTLKSVTGKIDYGYSYGSWMAFKPRRLRRCVERDGRKAQYLLDLVASYRIQSHNFLNDSAALHNQSFEKPSSLRQLQSPKWCFADLHYYNSSPISPDTPEWCVYLLDRLVFISLKKS